MSAGSSSSSSKQQPLKTEAADGGESSFLNTNDTGGENEGRVAVITGASSGIGKATALLFVREKAFRALSLCGRSEAELLRTRSECLRVRGDEMMDPDSIIVTIGDLREECVGRMIVKRTIEAFGRIDVLVNAAGILVFGRVEDTPVTELDRLMDVNVRSVVELTKFILPHIIERKGAIVNVSSICGPCAFPAVAYYCMTKAALDQFTKCLALELAPKGVRVNSVNPGVVVTDLQQRAGMSEEDYAAFLRRGAEVHPMGRVANAEEVANAILFLAGPQSSFTTGHLLSVDGGRSLAVPR